MANRLAIRLEVKRPALKRKDTLGRLMKLSDKTPFPGVRRSTAGRCA